MTRDQLIQAYLRIAWRPENGTLRKAIDSISAIIPANQSELALDALWGELKKEFDKEAKEAEKIFVERRAQIQRACEAPINQAQVQKTRNRNKRLADEQWKVCQRGWFDCAEQESDWWDEWLFDFKESNKSREDWFDGECAKWKKRRNECAMRQVEFEEKQARAIASGSLEVWHEVFSQMSGFTGRSAEHVTTSDDAHGGPVGFRVCGKAQWDNAIRAIEDGQ